MRPDLRSARAAPPVVTEEPVAACGRVGREPFFWLTAVYCGKFFQFGKFFVGFISRCFARNFNKNRRDRRFLPVTAVTWPRAVA